MEAQKGQSMGRTKDLGTKGEEQWGWNKGRGTREVVNGVNKTPMNSRDNRHRNKRGGQWVRDKEEGGTKEERTNFVLCIQIFECPTKGYSVPF